jgi:hypothetical protein
MTTRHPPRVALWLLNRILPAGDPLTGDLVEEFGRRRSRLWFWRQTAGAFLARRERNRLPVAPLGLTDEPVDGLATVDRHVRTVNLTASPIYGIGGLGLVALATLVSIMSPASWLVAVAIVLTGLVLGGALAYARGRRAASRVPPASPLTRG